MKLYRLLQATIISMLLFSCSQNPTTELSLEGTRWELIEVAGNQVQQYLDQRKPFIQFDADSDNREGVRW